MVSGANQRLAVALAAQCTVLVIMAIRLLGLGGVSHEAVPYTRYSEWGDVMFDVATQAVRREMGRPSVWHQSVICLAADWAPERFRKRFRVPKELAETLVYGLTITTRTFTDNLCQNPNHRCVLVAFPLLSLPFAVLPVFPNLAGVWAVCRYTARFKTLVCLYNIAQGGALTLTADLAGVSPQLLCTWRSEFTKGVALAFTHTYMPVSTPQLILTSNTDMASRRGIWGCPIAVDGTHVPFKPRSAQVRTLITRRHW